MIIVLFTPKIYTLEAVSSFLRVVQIIAFDQRICPSPRLGCSKVIADIGTVTQIVDSYPQLIALVNNICTETNVSQR